MTVSKLTAVLPAAACAMAVAAGVDASNDACTSDLYIGYYRESPVANPEDPRPGALHVLIPRADGVFSGEMFFTYEGCQSRNVGTVTGNRAGTSLTGTWSGTLDGTAQSGSFTGSAGNQGLFAGSYRVDGGKQTIEIEDCIEYIISPVGDWLLFPVLEQLPDDDLLTIVDAAVTWTPVPDAEFVQCQLLELDEDNCNAATTALWQQVTLADQESVALPKSFLVNGSNYAVACAQFDAAGSQLAFSKSSFAYQSDSGPSYAGYLVPVNMLLLE